MENMGYQDPDVPRVNGGIEVQDAQTCQSYCRALVGCQVFTFYINSGGCWLQGLSGKVPTIEPVPGSWSGPATCPDEPLSEAKVSVQVAAVSTTASSTPSSPQVEKSTKKEELHSDGKVVVVTDSAAAEMEETAAIAAKVVSVHEEKKEDSKSNGILFVYTVGATLIPAAVLAGVAFACQHCKGKSARKHRCIDLGAPDSPTFSARSPGSPNSQVSWMQEEGSQVDAGSPGSRATWAQEGSQVDVEEGLGSPTSQMNEEMAQSQMEEEMDQSQMNEMTRSYVEADESNWELQASIVSGAAPASEYAASVAASHEALQRQRRNALPAVSPGMVINSPPMGHMRAVASQLPRGMAMPPQALPLQVLPPQALPQQALFREPVATGTSGYGAYTPNRPLPRDLFEILDKNGDGVITRDEFNMPMYR